MPQDDAQYITQLNPAWPTLAEKQYTWPGHYQAIKRSIKQSFLYVDDVVEATQAQLNLLQGKSSIFNAFLGEAIRKTYFSVPLTSGLSVSFFVGEADVGDFIKVIPNAAYPVWNTMLAKAAWVIEKGRIGVFFLKIGTTDPAVEDTGLMDVLIVRPL